MADNWHDALDELRPYMFKIYTPQGEGTGFMVSFAARSKMLGIATAYHVIDHAYEWDEPIRLRHHHSGGEFTIRASSERFIFTYPSNDLAFIVIDLKRVTNLPDLGLPTDQLGSIEEGKRMRQGVQMGWCGFPSVARNDLCFFHGHVSSWMESENHYLVDGVAINGVSGGPAFSVLEDGVPEICGVVTAYSANFTVHGPLPGVCMIVDPSPYYDGLRQFKSVEDAERAAAKEKADAEQVAKDDEPKQQ